MPPWSDSSVALNQSILIDSVFLLGMLQGMKQVKEKCPFLLDHYIQLLLNVFRSSPKPKDEKDKPLGVVPIDHPLLVLQMLRQGSAKLSLGAYQRLGTQY